MTVLTVADAPARPKADPDDNHLTCCCDPDTSLCGLDLSEVPEGDFDDDETCLVCLALDDVVCPDCPH